MERNLPKIITLIAGIAALVIVILAFAIFLKPIVQQSMLGTASRFIGDWEVYLDIGTATKKSPDGPSFTMEFYTEASKEKETRLLVRSSRDNDRVGSFRVQEDMLLISESRSSREEKMKFRFQGSNTIILQDPDNEQKVVLLKRSK